MAKNRQSGPPPDDAPLPPPPPGEELRPLPCNIDAERFSLGSILLNGERYQQVAGIIEADDFSIESHRRIFLRMQELHAAGDSIDRVTVANALMRNGQLQFVGGLTYLTSLDSGLPEIPNVESYAKIVKEKATLRKAIFAAQSLISRCYDGEESATVLKAAEQSIRDLDYRGRKVIARKPSQVIDEYPGGINAFLDPTTATPGLMTGFSRHDEMTGGWKPGDFILISARPSMGKTSLGMNIVHNLIFAGIPVGVFSLEMTTGSLLRRMACARGLVDNHKLRNGWLNAEERKRYQIATSEIYDAPLFLLDESSRRIDQIETNSRAIVEEHGVKLIVIDYLGLMESAKGMKYENRNNQISDWSRRIKLLAKELGIPFLVLSQMSRPDKSRVSARPELTDLRDSGSLEQDSDLVLFIWREEMVKRDREDLVGKAELICRKQREGPLFTAMLNFRGKYYRFDDSESASPEE